MLDSSAVITKAENGVARGRNRASACGDTPQIATPQ